MKNIVNKKYKSNCHQKYRTRYHFIFSTKYRKKCLKGIEAETELAFRYSESISDYKILYFGIDKDHVHLLVEFKPSLSIGQVVNRMKSITTNELWKNKSEHLSKFYWKNKKLLWTHGYFAETTGNVSEANIAEYILEQGLK
jgi:putative transposase